MLKIERQKMSVEVKKEKSLASLQGLISWMETEMKSKMRATAPLRSARVQDISISYSQGNHRSVGFVTRQHIGWIIVRNLNP